MFITKFAAILAVCVIAVPAVAQEEVKVAATTIAADVTKSVEKSVKVMLNEDGKLAGKAFLSESKEAASLAKVTLTAAGKVIDAVETDEEGNFSFANVAPGAYKMLGAANGFVGSQSYDVVPYSSPAVGSPVSFGMNGVSSDVVYDSYSSAPVSSFSSSCGSGFGGGGGGRLGGRLGGGMLGNGRIGLLGLVGLAGLAGDDASPDR